MGDTSNTEDVIDSREIIERIEELEDACKPWAAGYGSDTAGTYSDRETFATWEEARAWLLAEADDARDENTREQEDNTDPDAAATMYGGLIDAIGAAAVGALFESVIGTGNYRWFIEAAEVDADEAAELAELREVAKQGEDYASEWSDGATLIRESYFEEYAQELAAEIGAIKKNAAWPLNHIDWEAAAEALKVDYIEIDHGGIAYLVRQ